MYEYFQLVRQRKNSDKHAAGGCRDMDEMAYGTLEPAGSAVAFPCRRCFANNQAHFYGGG